MSQARASTGWRKSSFCDNADCLEVRTDDGVVAVRNNTRPEALLSVDPTSWQALVVGVRDGQLTR